MSTFSKRARENKRAEKAREKARRRAERRDAAPAEPEIVSASDIVGDLMSIEEVLESMNGGGHVSRASSGIPSKLFVGSLSDETTSASLEAHFAADYDILEATVIRDRSTGQSRCFGFVTVASHKDAPKVIQALDASELDGRRISVRVATER